MLPLLFVCTSQYRPLRVRNPIRCNRRILSQPCFYRSYSPRYPFGAPLRSHLLYLSVSFLSALRNVLCKTSMINTLFLIAFAYSYSSTGNVPCQCSFVLLFSQDQDRVSRKRDFCTGALRGLFSGIKFSQQYQIFRCRLSYGKSGQIYSYSLSRGISQQ